MVYKGSIENFLQGALSWGTIQGLLSHVDILKLLLAEPILSYYNIEGFLDELTIENLLEGLELEELVSIINVLHEYIFYSEVENEFLSWFTDICKQALSESISDYISDVNISEYCDNYDIQDLVNDNMSYGRYGVEINEDRVKGIIEGWINDDIYEEISDKIGILREGLQIKIDIPTVQIDKGEIDDVINSYLESGDGDYGDHYEGRGSSGESYVNEIEAIFER